MILLLGPGSVSNFLLDIIGIQTKIFAAISPAMAETPALMYTLAIILTVLAFSVIVLRFYARYIKKAGFSWDDYMILPAMVFTIGTAIGMIIGE